MFQHIMKNKHTKIMWKWGPVTAYELDLEGIDSSGDGAADVMEIIGRQDASRVTQQLILDNMMQGFLYKLFQQKWERYGWFLHYIWCGFDLCILVLIAYLGLAIKDETEKHLQKGFIMLTALCATAIAIEAFVASLFLENMQRSQREHKMSMASLTKRTWEWMSSFSIDLKLIGYAILAVAAYMYLSNSSTMHPIPHDDVLANFSFPDQEDLMDHAAPLRGRQLRKAGGGAGGKSPLLVAAEFGYDPRDAKDIEIAILVENSEAAAIAGTFPLVCLLMGTGFVIQTGEFVQKFVMPVPAISTLVLSVKSTLRGELVVFMAIFIFSAATFFVTMFIMYPKHQLTAPLPQAPDFAAWWSAMEAMLLLSFVGQPFDLNLNPLGVAELGQWQSVGMFFFTGVYLFYVFFSVILLLNLLIALLGDTFSKTQQESILQGRIAFARCILRLELIADYFGLETRAGELSGDKTCYVHVFREVNLSADDEVRADEHNENIFDDLTNPTPKWALGLMERLDAMPKSTTDMLMHEIAEGDRLRTEDAEKKQLRAEMMRAGKNPNKIGPNNLPLPAILPPPSTSAPQLAAKPFTESSKSSRRGSVTEQVRQRTTTDA